MRVFVTGASGFVGSHVVREFLRQGVSVATLVRDPARAWRIADLLPRVRVVPGDLATLGAGHPELAAFAPEAVVHLAWQGVLNRDRNDVAQWRNVADSLALVETCAKLGASTFVGLGSQAEYGAHSARIDETFATRPTTVYGAAKLATSIVAGRMSDALGLRFAWLRLFSAYGPTDSEEWMIPYVMLALLRGERPAVTSGEQQWDYLFVEDAAKAIVATTLAPGASGIFNLGSGSTSSIRSIIERIRDNIDPALPVDFGAVAYRADQVMRLEANIERLRAATGWHVHTGLDTGLARTLEWYRANATAY
jgi:UDP-glucose 4-epimerase